MLEFSKILFVTDMDTSPGPLAATLLKHYLPLEQVNIDSRGLAVLFPELRTARRFGGLFRVGRFRCVAACGNRPR